MPAEPRQPIAAPVSFTTLNVDRDEQPAQGIVLCRVEATEPCSSTPARSGDSTNSATSRSSTEFRASRGGSITAGVQNPVRGPYLPTGSVTLRVWPGRLWRCGTLRGAVTTMLRRLT